MIKLHKFVLLGIFSFLTILPKHSIVNAQSLRFLYDGDGVRIAKIENDKTTVYVGDLEKNLTSGELIKYYSIGGKRVVIKNNSGINYIISDHLGSTSVVSDAQGYSKGVERYYPYGTMRNQIGEDTSRQYTSQINDTSTDLYYYNARYYNPRTANFIQADFKSNILNRYGYVSQNPVNLVDPSGYESELPPMEKDAMIEYAKSKYGVSFIGMDIGWSVSEMRSAFTVFDLFPPSVVQGKNFYRANGGERGGEVSDETPNDIYIYPDPGKVRSLGRIDNLIMDENKINYTIEHLVAHELMHTIHINNPALITQFVNSMELNGFGWAVLDWRRIETESSERIVEQMTERFLNKVNEIKNKPFSQVNDDYVPGIGFTLATGGMRPFPTWYSWNVPEETFAEFGMLYYLDVAGGMLGYQNYERIPVQFYETIDSNLRGSTSNGNSNAY
jgi:RHS repeat-associated protein